MKRRISHLQTLFVCLACLALRGSRADASAISFDFKDPKGVNAIAFILDSPLEPIMGVASGISGTVSFDPVDPKSITGRLIVQTKGLHTENKGMKDTLHGPDWLDAEKNRTIEFEFKKVVEAKTIEKDEHELTVLGELTCKGVKKELTVPVRVSYLPGRLSERLRQAKGDLLVLRSSFTIKRSDFGIKPDVGDKVVANEIELRVSIAGGAVKE